MLSKVIAVWAAVGVALTGATQLRLAGQPIGPGELILALWMAFFVFCLLRGVRFSYSEAFRPFAIFWGGSFILLAAGSVVAIHLDRMDRWVSHYGVAFAFSGLLTCFMAIRLGEPTSKQYYLSFARALFFLISIIGCILLAASLVTAKLGPISLWYYDTRFRGWSENPNQFALFMLPMPFLGWYLLQQTRGLVRKLIYLLAILVCAAAGVATQSDAVRVAWGGAFGTVAAYLWYRAVFRGRSRFLHVSHLLLPLAAIVLAVGLGPEIVERGERIVAALYHQRGQGNIRITAWLHALEAFGHSPLVGLGPGAYGGHDGPFRGLEAHNTFIDWAVNAGLLGLVALVLLSFWCAWRALRVGAMPLLGLAIVIILDSLFHNIARQPIYWLLLMLVVVLTERTDRQTAPSSVELPHQGIMSSPKHST